MNIAIIESISRSNEESKKILQSTQEQSLKRRTQIKDYNTFYSINEGKKGIFSKFIDMIKSHWYC
jgi:hypothetical protein